MHRYVCVCLCMAECVYVCAACLVQYIFRIFQYCVFFFCTFLHFVVFVFLLHFRIFQLLFSIFVFLYFVVAVAVAHFHFCFCSAFDSQRKQQKRNFIRSLKFALDTVRRVVKCCKTQKRRESVNSILKLRNSQSEIKNQEVYKNIEPHEKITKIYFRNQFKLKTNMKNSLKMFTE